MAAINSGYTPGEVRAMVAPLVASSLEEMDEYVIVATTKDGRLRVISDMPDFLFRRFLGDAINSMAVQGH